MFSQEFSLLIWAFLRVYNDGGLLLLLSAFLLAVSTTRRSVVGTALALYLLAASLKWVSPWEFLGLLLWSLGAALLPRAEEPGVGISLISLLSLIPRTDSLQLAALVGLWLIYMMAAVADEYERNPYHAAGEGLWINRGQAALAAMPLPMAVFESAPLAAAASVAVFTVLTLIEERPTPPKSLLAFIPSTAVIAAGFAFGQLSVALAAAAVINAVAALAMLAPYFSARRAEGEPLVEINVARRGLYFTAKLMRRRERRRRRLVEKHSSYG